MLTYGNFLVCPVTFQISRRQLCSEKEDLVRILQLSIQFTTIHCYVWFDTLFLLMAGSDSIAMDSGIRTVLWIRTLW
jgi:hypothetical protein